MEYCPSPDFFERYQTFIVGALGFIGVILTLITNAWITRRERHASTNHDREALRVALLEELKIKVDALASGIDTLEKAQKDGSGGILIPTYEMSDVYNVFISRIGLLRAEQVRKIMFAYLSERDMDQKLRLFHHEKAGDGGHLHLNSKYFQAAKSMHKQLLAAMKEAVAAIND